MLPGHRRIRRADEFRSVMRGPVRAATTTVVVHMGPLPGGPGAAGPARAGLVVGRSVGGAVDRNRIKRRLRHIVTPLLDDVPSGWGVVLRALPAAADASGSVLAQDVSSALRRCLARLGHGPMTRQAVSQ